MPWTVSFGSGGMPMAIIGHAPCGLRVAGPRRRRAMSHEIRVHPLVSRARVIAPSTVDLRFTSSAARTELQPQSFLRARDR